MVLKNTGLVWCTGPMRSAAREGQDLLGGSVLGDGLGALGDGVLGELPWEEEADGGLDLAGRERGLGVVLGELAGLGGDALEDVVDERVHDEHALGRDAGVRVDLLEHLVDVDGVGLLALLAALASAGGGLGLAGLLFAFLGSCWWHDDNVQVRSEDVRC